MRFAILLMMLAMTISAEAQKRTIQNLPYVDDKWLHFGFVLGFHTQDFALTPANGVVDEKGIEWKGDEAILSAGFTVGIISDLRLSRYFNLRCVPTLNFGQRDVSFAGYKDGTKVDEFKTQVMSTQLMIPLSVKFRSQRVNNYRPYLLTGCGASVDITRNGEAVLMLKPLDFFAEVGIGCDIYLQYFKLAPELKFCVGFRNMIERDRPSIEKLEDIRYTNAIDRLFSRLLILSFNFE